jgi:hypothetical protein
MRTKYLGWLCIGVLPLMSNMCWGCEDKEPPMGPIYPTLGEFKQDHSKARNVFQLAPSVTTAFTLQGGTVLEVTTDSILDNSGNPVTGPVYLTVTEINTPKEILLNDMDTRGDGMLLSTFGMYYVSVSTTGTILQAPLKLHIPAPPGSPDSAQVYGRYYYTNLPWLPELHYKPGVGRHRFVHRATLKNNAYFLMPVKINSSFTGWTTLVDPLPSTTASVLNGGTFQTPATEKKPELRLLLDNRQAMLKLELQGNQFSSGSIKIPDGQPAHIVGLQREKGILYFGKTTLTTGSAITPHVELSEISEDSLLIELNAL